MFCKCLLFCKCEKVKQLEEDLDQHRNSITALHTIAINQQQVIEQLSSKIDAYEAQRRQLLTSTWGRNAAPDTPPVYKPAP